MIPRYHGRWNIADAEKSQQMGVLYRTIVLVVWDSVRCQYVVREVGSIQPRHTVGRNGILRWLKEVKAEPVDGQHPVA